MKHNNLPPSPFGAGTQYDGAGKHIVSPEHHSDTYSLPKIARNVGEKATETAMMAPARMQQYSERALVDVQTEPQVVSIADLQSPVSVNAYEGVASRQAALEAAEVQNIIHRAAELNISVDQYKASRPRS